MNIVTGYKGTPHISSNDQQGLNQGIFGTGNCVLNVGNKFSATLTDVNTVTISDGEGVMQGVHFRVEPGTTDTVNIENGTAGYNRIDLICARYTKNATTGVENVEWAVITGTPNASTASAPSYNTGDILSGDSPVDYPMFKVTLTGLTPVVSSLIEEQKTIADLTSLLNISQITASGTAKAVSSVATNVTGSSTFTLQAGKTYFINLNGYATFASSDGTIGNTGLHFELINASSTALDLPKAEIINTGENSSTLYSPWALHTCNSAFVTPVSDTVVRCRIRVPSHVNNMSASASVTATIVEIP